MSMKLEIVIPIRVWEKLNELEQRAGVRKEDILMSAVVKVIEGFKCPGCGAVVKVFE
jgi:hypothetical protein